MIYVRLKKIVYKEASMSKVISKIRPINHEKEYVRINRTRQWLKAYDMSYGIVKYDSNIDMPYIRGPLSYKYISRKHLIPDYVRLR